jgi:hypothetical protein
VDYGGPKFNIIKEKYVESRIKHVKPKNLLEKKRYKFEYPDNFGIVISLIKKISPPFRFAPFIFRYFPNNKSVEIRLPQQ